MKYLFKLCLCFVLLFTNCTPKSTQSSDNYTIDTITGASSITIEPVVVEFDSLTIQKLEKEHFITKYDEFAEITWVLPKNKPKYINTNGCYAYMSVGTSGVATNLRLVVQYASEEWIFFDKIEWAITMPDSSVITEILLNLENKRDHGYNKGVWEWYDETAYGNPDVITVISSLAKCKSAKYRLVGKLRSKTYTMSKAQIESFKYVDSLYHLRKGCIY